MVVIVVRLLLIDHSRERNEGRKLSLRGDEGKKVSRCIERNGVYVEKGR